MKERNYGLDLFRILCCLGVLNYHIIDDVMGGGGIAKLLYFGSSFCIPGFFLLSGFLLQKKDLLTVDYCEKKIVCIIKKLFAWIVFWTAIHFLLTGEIYDLVSQFMLGAQQGGILPVSWFLFTYCALMIVAYPLNKLLQKHSCVFGFITVIVMIILALGGGKDIVSSRAQTLWIHLYLGYFILGMFLSYMFNLNRDLEIVQNRKFLIIILFLIYVVSLIIYIFKIKTAVVFLAPHEYYGKWYYTAWLTSMFCLMYLAKINSDKLQICIGRLAENTLVVYLGHLPILLYITASYPLQTVSMAVVFVIIHFVGLEIAAEVFRKMPLLRKLV